MATGDQSRGFCKHSDHPWTKYDNVIPTIPLSWSIYIVYSNNLSVLLLAVDIGDFRRQRSTRFHETKVIIMPNSLILMSSTSFDEYLNAGTTCTKFGQNG